MKRKGSRGKTAKRETAIPLIRDYRTTINAAAAAIVRCVAEAQTARYSDQRKGEPPFHDEGVLAEALSHGLHALALEYLGSPSAWSAQKLVSDRDRLAESEPWPVRVDADLAQLARRVAALEAAASGRKGRK